MLTLNEMARLLRVHPSTIYRLIRQHKVPVFRVGCEWRFDLDEVNKWIDKLNGKISDTPKEKLLELNSLTPAMRRKRQK